MATEIQKESAYNREKDFHKVRPKYFDGANHINDSFKNLGYDYTGKILKNTTSPELWANPIQIPFYERIEGILNFLVEQVKYIKKTFSIAHDKESIKIN